MLRRARKNLISCVTRNYVAAVPFSRTCRTIMSQPLANTGTTTSALKPESMVTITHLPRHTFSTKAPEGVEVLGLPSLSPTMETGTVVKWVKNVGDAIKAGDLVAEIQTDKAVVDFVAQEDSYLAVILVPAGGDAVSIGTPIAILTEEPEQMEAAKTYASTLGSASASTAATPATPTPAPAPAPAAPTPASTTAAVASAGVNGFEHILPLSPAVGHMVHTYNLDISKIPPTGPKNRLLKGDVLAYMAAQGITKPAVKSTPTTASTASTTTKPVETKQAAPRANISGRRAAARKYIDVPVTAETTERNKNMVEARKYAAQSYIQLEMSVKALRSFINTYAVDATVHGLVTKIAARAISEVLGLHYTAVVINADTNTACVVKNAGNAPESVFTTAYTTHSDNVTNTPPKVVFTLQNAPVAFSRENIPANHCINVSFSAPYNKAIMPMDGVIAADEAVMISFTVDQAILSETEIIEIISKFKFYSAAPENMLI